MPDVLVLKVKSRIEKEPIYILHVYNLLIKSKQAGNSAKIVIRAIGLLRKQFHIMGNVNLYHIN